MYIDWLQIQNVRNLSNLRIQPSSKLNIFIGPNASGKTSILEAIYLLSRARSFRTPRIREVIQHNQPTLLVTASLKKANGAAIKTGIEKAHDKTIIHYNGENIKKTSVQAKNFPLVLIAPDVNRLVIGPPKQRRNWLDWAMFHVEPTYLDDWRNYYKALRQRNKALSNPIRAYDAMSGWEHIMAETAERITTQRHEFLKKTQQNLEVIGKKLLQFKTQICVDKGWPGTQPFLEFLENSREVDRQSGYTKNGIQSSDVHFFADKRPVAAICSRGQIKLFLLLLLISQAQALEIMTGEQPLYLMDDYRAEIDAHARRHVLDLLSELNVQAFITTTETEAVDARSANVKMFHVERGEVVKVVE